MGYKDIATIISDAYAKARIYCKCGHSIVISNKRKYKICSWCGRLVFKNKRAEFDYRLAQAITREKVRKL